MEKCIDISKHQTAFNPSKCKSAGVKSVMCRFAYSTSEDKKLADYSALVKNAGLSLGGYGFGTWHYRSKNNGSIEQARSIMRTEVAKWISLAQKYGCSSWFGIDQELENNQAMGLNAAANTVLLVEAAKMLETAGIKACLYASASWVASYVSLAQFTFPLWIAYYKWYGTPKSFDNVSETFPANSGTWGKWMNTNKNRICMWQFTSEGYADQYGCAHGSNGLDKNWLYFHPTASVKEDMEETVEQTSVSSTSTYFKKYTGTSPSIVTALTAIGASSSYAYRTTIASVNGIKNYTGTAAQNTQMLNLLKQGKLICPATYFKKYTGSSSSIATALNAIGEKNDYNYRKTIAAKNNIANYSGTAAQNTQMLNLLKQGKLIKP